MSMPPFPSRPLQLKPHYYSPPFFISSINTSFERPSRLSVFAGSENYNHLLQALCWKGDLRKALQLLSHLKNPTQRTYSSLIEACARKNVPSLGEIVHSRVIDDGFDQDSFVSARLVDMYSKFGRVDDARKVFDETSERTIFLWHALLRALVANDRGEEMLEVLKDMVQSGLQLDSFCYCYSLKACLALSSQTPLAFGRVRQIHGHVLRRGCERTVHVATTLVDAYAKMGWVSYSRNVFDGMPVKNVVSWSAMICCYASNDSAFDALLLFQKMILSELDFSPNSVTMVSVLQACASLGALLTGKLLHAYILRRGLDSILSVLNALIAMYAKCACLDKAYYIFERMDGRRDVVSWNSLISGYGFHGHGMKAVGLFEKMIQEGISPTSLTFVCVLSACSHSGLVQEGKKIFNSMLVKHKIIPSAEHYACMVDLLGRARHLDEASNMIEEMQIETSSSIWGSLLGACRIHGNVQLAEKACLHLFELEPENAGNYVLLADIYAGAEMWEEFASIKKKLEAKGLWKIPGRSWIEVKKRIYSFVSVVETNPQIEPLHSLLVQLVTEMKDGGYVPNTKLVLYDLDQQEKEQILLFHSEKLAVAFGLINTCEGEIIRVTNNLRLCEDCHEVTKFISRFSRREIIVRDVNRVHHFKDGFCSCSDYW